MYDKAQSLKENVTGGEMVGKGDGGTWTFWVAQMVNNESLTGDRWSSSYDNTWIRILVTHDLVRVLNG